MTQYSYETKPTVVITPFDVEQYPLSFETTHDDILRPFQWYTKFDFDLIIPMGTPTNFTLFDQFKEPRFNPDEVIAFIGKGDNI